MPTIDWTADQGEEVRQMILDHIDCLTERIDDPANAVRVPALLAMADDMRVILKKLEAAYANH